MNKPPIISLKPQYALFQGNKLVKKYHFPVVAKLDKQEGQTLRRWYPINTDSASGFWTIHFHPIKREIGWAFCENELWHGYPCGTEGCPHCGGPDNAHHLIAEAEARFAK